MKARTLLYLAFALVLSQCKISNMDEDATDNTKPVKTEIGTINIPEGFDYSTSKKVNIEIGGSFSKNQLDGKVKYSIYMYDERYTETITVNENGILDPNGTISHTINNSGKYKITSIVTNTLKTLEVEVPIYIEKLLIIKDDYGLISSQIVPLNTLGKKTSASAIFNNEIALDGDVTYAELGRSQFVVHDNGNVTQLSDFPEFIDGIEVLSSGIAIDSRNNIKYNVNAYAPYHIIRSSIGQENYEIVGNQEGKSLGLGFPTTALGWNDHDKSLYVIEIEDGTGFSYIHRVDPIWGGHSDKRWKLVTDVFNKELIITSVGDITVTDEGDIIFSTSNGVFELQRIDNDLDNLQVGLYDDTDTWGSQILGLDITSTNELLINKNDDGTVGILDYVAPNQGQYTPGAGTELFLSDLAIFRSKLANFADEDSDGISDYYDEYPLNPELAFNEYCPSLYGHYTLLAEDLWPARGDYDFNDLVMEYKSKKEMSSERLIVTRRMDFSVLHIGGSYKNGIGVVWEEEPSKVESFTTPQTYTEGYIETLPNGLEANQKNIVTIIFDNAREVEIGHTIQTVTNYSTPIDCPTGGNIIMIINGDRERELSFANKTPTDLAGLQWFNIGHDVSNIAEGNTYKGATNLPWMIRLTGEIDFIPKEKVKITEAFTKFKQWAESGGTEFTDWQLDVAGYRNLENMEPIVDHEH